MDHLQEATGYAREAREAPYNDDTAKVPCLLAIAHALIALCERLDAVTGTPANTQEKSIRVINKPT